MQRPLVSTLILSALVFSAPALAQTKPVKPKPIAPTVVAPTKSSKLTIAVVDFAAISARSKAMTEVRKQAQALGSRFEKERLAAEKSIRRDIAKLEKRQPVMPLQDFEKARVAMQRRIANLRRTVQLRRQQLALAFRISNNKFGQKVVKIVQGMAVEKGYSIVINKGTVVHVSPSLDVTAEAMKRVNAQIPKIAFQFPPKRPVRPAPPKK